MKTRIKVYHTCVNCQKRLTLQERAFNETLCNECQWKVNNEAYKILAPIVKKMKFN